MILSLTCWILPSQASEISIELAGHKHPKRCLSKQMEMCVMLVEKNELVPFRGILQTVKQAAEVTAKINKLKREHAIEIKRLEQQHQTQLQTLRMLQDVSLQSCNSQKELLKQRQPKWYTSPWFVIPTTFTLAVTLDNALRN